MLEGLIPTEVFLREVEPAYGDTWEESFKHLLEDPYEREIIELLKADWQRDGKFQESITVGEDEETGRKYVGNGMHRITTLVELGASHIPVGPPSEDYDEDAVMIDLTFSVEFTEKLDWEETMDKVASLVRSFPLSENEWVEVSGLGGGTGGYNATWDFPMERKEELFEGLRKRIEKHGGKFTVVKVGEWGPKERAELDEWVENNLK